LTRLSAILVAAVALAIGVSAQAGAARVIRTNFFWISIATESSPPHYFAASVTGVIDAAKPRCAKNRKVILYFKRGRHKRHVRDIERSRHHLVTLAGHSRSEPGRLIFRVTKKRVENHGHPYTCWPDHQAFNLRRFLKETEGTRGPDGAVKHRVTRPAPAERH
jgi:hypothetical protein